MAWPRVRGREMLRCVKTCPRQRVACHPTAKKKRAREFTGTPVRYSDLVRRLRRRRSDTASSRNPSSMVRTKCAYTRARRRASCSHDTAVASHSNPRSRPLPASNRPGIRRRPSARRRAPEPASQAPPRQCRPRRSLQFPATQQRLRPVVHVRDSSCRYLPEFDASTWPLRTRPSKKLALLFVAGYTKQTSTYAPPPLQPVAHARKARHALGYVTPPSHVTGSQIIGHSMSRGHPPRPPPPPFA